MKSVPNANARPAAALLLIVLIVDKNGEVK